MTFQLRLSRSILEEMLAQARAELPNECCGLLAGFLAKGTGRVEKRYPLVNAAASPVEYLSEPRSMFLADKDMRRRGLRLLAIYHSHPTTVPIPSKKDLANHYSPEVVHLIISLASDEPEVRGWWLTESDYRPADWVSVEEQMHNPFLIGATIYLRPLESGDIPKLVAWFNDPEVLRTVLRSDPITREVEEQWLTRIGQSPTDLVLGIAKRESNQLLGVTGLHRIDWQSRHAEFGIAIGEKNEWGKGYGTEATRLILGHAFRTLNLHRVWLHVLAGHLSALRAYEKTGFVQEGILRQQLYKEGRYQDLVTMAILRSEWEALSNEH